MSATPDLLTPEEVAALLRVTPATLTYWRKRKTGPAYVKVGRKVRYPRLAVYAGLTVIDPAAPAPSLGVVS